MAYKYGGSSKRQSSLVGDAGNVAANEFEGKLEENFLGDESSTTRRELNAATAEKSSSAVKAAKGVVQHEPSKTAKMMRVDEAYLQGVTMGDIELPDSQFDESQRDYLDVAIECSEYMPKKLRTGVFGN